MVTAFWRLTISATAGAPPNSPSRVQGSSWPQATRRRLVRKLVTSPPSSGDMVSSALITAWSWMLQSHVGDLHAIPISHGEGRFTAPQAELERLIANGQIATQYVDASGAASMDIDANPNGSLEAIEGIFSPDGRVFGKMGHSERRGPYVGVNIPGDKHQPLFESGAAYFR